MKPIRVLLVEDNPADADLTRETLASSRLRPTIEVVSDGAAAVDYLMQRGEYASAARPDLVILDLNLPKLDGRDVLTEVRRSAELKSLPVVVLTSSEAERDIVQSYESGANCYVTKPVGLKEFQGIVRSIDEFWFSVARLPMLGVT